MSSSTSSIATTLYSINFALEEEVRHLDDEQDGEGGHLWQVIFVDYIGHCSYELFSLTVLFEPCWILLPA